jgi:hypothetical protein
MATLQGTTISGDLHNTQLSILGAGSTGFQGYWAYWRNNLAYTVDFNVRNVGAGATFWCSACYNHSGNSYGAGNEAFIVRYSGTGAAAYTMHSYTTGAGGSCGWSSPNLTQIRITKNAGYYPGLGGAIIQVNGPV